MNIPLSLYIHFPWCIQKCPYCDFNSHTAPVNLPQESYIRALMHDLHQSSTNIQGRPLTSIFMGGGTPSLIDPALIKHLLDHISTRFSSGLPEEITLEANPGTIDEMHLQSYSDAGITRISMGAQSFNSSQLKKLGRIHDPESVYSAINTLHQLPLHSFNVDLMYALPEQSVEEALSDLQTLIALDPPHISWYQLTIEPHTLFFKRPPQQPDEDRIIEIEEAGHVMLKNAGYIRYEISAYAKNGHQCKHNLNYWKFGDYLGIGAGAHGKITVDNQINRTWKIKQPNEYIQSDRKMRGEKKVTSEERPLEFFLNTMRLVGHDISLDTFEQHTLLDREILFAPLSRGKQQGWLTFDDCHVQLTPHGHQFLNHVLELFC